MRKNMFTFRSQKVFNFTCFFTFLFLSVVFSQEKEDSQDSDLSKSLNVAVTEIHKPKFQKTPTGNSSGEPIDDSEISYKYYDSSDEWMQIVFRYTLEDWIDEGAPKLSRDEKKLNPLVPEVAFKIFVEGKKKQTGKQDYVSVLLTGESTYVNVKKTDSSSKYRYGLFFISPETVEHYELKELFNSNKGNIRVEAYIGDKKALKGKNADESYKDLKEKDEDWDKLFKEMQQIKSSVVTKDLTPWAFSSMDKFPMLKPKSSEKK